MGSFYQESQINWRQIWNRLSLDSLLWIPLIAQSLWPMSFRAGSRNVLIRYLISGCLGLSVAARPQFLSCLAAFAVELSWWEISDRHLCISWYIIPTLRCFWTNLNSKNARQPQKLPG